MTDDLTAMAERLLGAFRDKALGNLNELGERLGDATAYPFLVTPDHRLHWVYLFAFFLIGLFVYRHHKPSAREFRLKDFLRFWLPGSIYLHRSTILDLKYFVINRVVAEAIFLSTLIGSFAAFGEVVESGLRALWAGPAWSAETAQTARILYAIALILAADLGFFLGHLLGHKVPLLWEFHKVHHSAEVLNPLTNYRFHPVDRVPIGLCTGLLTGTVNGVAAFLYPGGIGGLVAINVGVLLLFNLTANLRHSHLWLSYGWHLSHVLCSPAQHQIHHGTAARHLDRNFGLMFSLWDWIAGTLYVPRARERLAFGLTGGEHADYDSVWRLYALPFAKARALVATRAARRRAMARTGAR